MHRLPHKVPQPSRIKLQWIGALEKGSLGIHTVTSVTNLVKAPAPSLPFPYTSFIQDLTK